MSNETAVNLWYVKWDNMVYNFKYNFEIIEIPAIDVINEDGFLYGEGCKQAFTTKTEAVFYINALIEHQVKVLNMITKAIPKEPYTE